VLSRNKKTFAVSSLVLNLFASQIGEFFLPHPVEAIKAQLKLTTALKCGATRVNVSGDVGNSNCSVPFPHVKHYSDQ